jgi:aminodeoxyfutalosine synthase
MPSPAPMPVNPSSAAETVLQKILDNERLTELEALELYASGDLATLARIGTAVRQRKHGSAVYYVVNRHINYSNICVLDCDFCAFGKRRRDPDAYELSIEEIVERGRQSVALGASEIHIVGGLHPTWKFEVYLSMLRALRALSPGMTLKAFTAIEILHFSWLAKLPVEGVLAELRAAGLNCLTGGGAEIFEPSVRRQICRGKESGEEWLAVHRAAHKVGLRSTATMLFGHLETHQHRVDHLRQLRELQDETGGFLAFLPLAFKPAHRLSHLSGPDEVEILRNTAVCRAYLDNFDHIKAYWISYGLALAERTIEFGADDMDGTIEEERIYHMAGVSSPVAQTVEALRAAITSAGCRPVLRDAFYEPIAAA